MELDDSLVRRILQDYPIESIDSIELIEQPQNKALIVESSGQTFTVEYMEGSVEHITWILDIRNYLARSQFPITKSIKNLDGKLFTEVGMARFVVKEWRDGTPPTSITKEDALGLTRDIGAYIGRLHRLLSTTGSSFRLSGQPRDIDIVTVLSEVNLERDTITFPQSSAVLDNSTVVAAYRKWQSQLEKLNVDSLTKNICHNNLRLDFILVGSDNSIVDIVDLSSMGWNYQVYDLATYLVNTDLYRSDIAPIFLPALAKSYLFASSIQKWELLTLRFFLLSHFLFQACFAFDRIHNIPDKSIIEQFKLAFEDGIEGLEHLEKIPKGFYRKLLTK